MRQLFLEWKKSNYFHCLADPPPPPPPPLYPPPPHTSDFIKTKNICLGLLAVNLKRRAQMYGFLHLTQAFVKIVATFDTKTFPIIFIGMKLSLFSTHFQRLKLFIE